MLKKALLLLLILLSVFPVKAEILDLPVDSSPGLPYNAAKVEENAHYQDPSITVDIYYGGRIHETNYTYAIIKIANATQLRTAMAYKYNSSYTKPGEAIAKANNAVFAINGDYYSFKSSGYLVRQGIDYRSRPEAMWDILLIDQNGDFHIITEPSDDKVKAWQEENPTLQIINSFNFGPAYIANGSWLMEDFSQALNHNKIADYRGCARMAICQLAPLTYLAVACEGETDSGSQGMTLNEFADCLKEIESSLDEYTIQAAYNLDGGRSTTMVLGGKKINSTSARSSRDIADMIYFASAWQPDKGERP